MKVLVWRRSFDGFDLIGRRRNAWVNYLAIRDRSRVAITTEPFQTGDHWFDVGVHYSLNIGNGCELRYEGLVSKRFLLFRLVYHGQVRLPAGRDIFDKLSNEYDDIYLTFIIADAEPGRLFWLTDGRKQRSLVLDECISPKSSLDEQPTVSSPGHSCFSRLNAAVTGYYVPRRAGVAIAETVNRPLCGFQPAAIGLAIDAPDDPVQCTGHL